MISCCAEEASADLLTQNTISNPKRFSVFSVVFQRRIPKCISLMLILCFEHAEVCKYFSVLLRSSVVFVRFSESNSLRFKLWVRVSRCNLPIFLLCPWSSQFSIFFLIKQFLCWGLEGIMKFDKGEKWLAGEVFFFFFFLSLFFFSLNSPNCLTLLVTLLLLLFYHSPSLSFFIVTLNQVSCFCPLFCPLFGPYSHSISHVPFPPSFSCSCSVLHRQFKSGFHSLFCPWAFNTVFNTKPQRWKAEEGE